MHFAIDKNKYSVDKNKIKSLFSNTGISSSPQGLNQEGQEVQWEVISISIAPYPPPLHLDRYTLNNSLPLGSMDWACPTKLRDICIYQC